MDDMRPKTDNTYTMKAYKLKVIEKSHGIPHIFHFTWNTKGWMVHDRDQPKDVQYSKKAIKLMNWRFKNLILTYPNDLGDIFEEIWQEIKTSSRTDKDIQKQFTKLGRWLSKINVSKPEL